MSADRARCDSHKGEVFLGHWQVQTLQSYGADMPYAYADDIAVFDVASCILAELSPGRAVASRFPQAKPDA